MKKHLIIELKKINFINKLDKNFISIIELEIIDFMTAIANEESCSDTDDFFNYLSIIHILLSAVLFKYDYWVGDKLRFFIDEYERIDLIDERKRIFNDISKHIMIMKS